MTVAAYCVCMLFERPSVADCFLVGENSTKIQNPNIIFNVQRTLEVRLFVCKAKKFLTFSVPEPGSVRKWLPLSAFQLTAAILCVAAKVVR